MLQKLTIITVLLVLLYCQLISCTITSLDIRNEKGNCTLKVEGNPVACHTRKGFSWTSKLRQHIDHVKMFLDILKRYYSEITNTTKEITTTKQEYLENALNTFSLLKRSAKDWKAVIKIALALPLEFNAKNISGPYAQKYKNVFMRSELHLEKKANLSSGFRGLVRLQSVYHIATDELANGKLDGALRHAILNTDDCFEMAKYCFKKEFDYIRAKEWLDEAVKKMKFYNKNEISKRDVLELNYFIQCFGGDVKGAEVTYDTLVRDYSIFSPSHWLREEYELIMKYGCGVVRRVTEEWREQERLKKKREKEDLLELIRLGNTEIVLEDTEDDKPLDEDDPKLLELCKQRTVSAKTERFLRCRYVHYNKPYLRVGPFKVEEYNIDPPVLMFHQVFHDKEIEEMVNFSKPKMFIAEISTDTLEGELDETLRTSYHAWIPNKELHLSARLSKRSALLSGWNLYLSEPNQVASYGLAGEFRPHVDAAPELNESYADYSVVMYYLNNVDKGGHTIFPVLNVSVAPVKGSAVLWFNRRPDGAADQKSMHAGCPVLQGTKWVMNKWFSVWRQNFPKCTKENNSSFKYYYI